MSDEKTLTPDWENVKTAMVIMAHPDDPDFTCSGTCIKMVEQGIEVIYMILTNGDKGNHNPDITREELIEMRQREQRAAAETSGVQRVLFMGEEDGFLQPTKELRKRVVREIRRFAPELIICPNPDRYFGGSGYINHPDHRNAGLVALEAVFPATDNMMFFPDLMDEGYMPHKISQLYVFGQLPGDDERDILSLDITDVIDKKIESILCHKSQISDPETARERWAKRWASREREDGEVRYFERFRALKFG